MAQSSSKVIRLLGYVRHEIANCVGFSAEVTPLSSKIAQGSPCVGHSSSNVSGTFMTSLKEQVGLPRYVNTLNLARGESSVLREGKKIFCTRGFISSCRSAYDNGLQRLSVNSHLQYGSATCSRLLSSSSRVKHELISLKSRDSIRGCRTYYVDNRGMQHFKKRGPASWSEKLVTQRSMRVILILAGGVAIVYFTHRETVPYTHRKHFVLVSPELEKSVGERTFDMLMKEYKSRVLPPWHPESMRVHRIADQIIEALMLGVKASDWGQVEKGGPDVIEFAKEWDPPTKKSDRPLLEPNSGLIHTHEDDSLDETWVDKSRKDGLEKGQEGYKKHLEGMKWTIVVVDDEIVNAICIPGGKIVVFTGLLKKFRSDAEVATVLAHEIGHAVARHSAESLTQSLFLVAMQLAVLSVFYMPELVNSVSELLLRLPFSRRMETEADHIGLILMAAAGYDPRLAPSFYEKLGNLEKIPEYAQYISTHPSGKKRGETLKKTGTMEQALQIYQQKMAGLGQEGFF